MLIILEMWWPAGHTSIMIWKKRQDVIEFHTWGLISLNLSHWRFAHGDRLMHFMMTYRTNLFIEHSFWFGCIIDCSHIVSMNTWRAWNSDSHHPEFMLNIMPCFVAIIQPQIMMSQFWNFLQVPLYKGSINLNHVTIPWFARFLICMINIQKHVGINLFFCRF